MAKASKTATGLCYVFFLIVFGISQANAVSTLTSDATLKYEKNMHLYVAGIAAYEIVLWDTFCMPLIVSVLASYNTGFKRIFSSLECIKF